MSDDLPQGWAHEALAELFDVNPGKPRADVLPPTTPVSFVPMAAVDAASATITQPEERPFGKVRNGYTAFADGDVILAKITPCFENGKAAMVRGLRNGLGFGSSEFHVFRPRGVVLAEYLFHFVRQQSFRDEAAERMAGTAGQARVPADHVKAVQLPFPPLPEQHRIIEKVEALLARLNAARARLAKVPAILKRFRQSVLAAACSGRLTEDWRQEHPDAVPMTATLEAKRAVARRAKARKSRSNGHEELDARDLPPIPNKWAWARLPELGELNRGRSRHRPRNDPRLFGGANPFIQTGDVARSAGRITSHGQTYNEAGLAQSRLWPARTVCITIAANIAESALLTYPACFPDSVVGLMAEPSLCLPEYAEFFIRTARGDLSQYAPATAQKNINLEILREVAVPLPPVTEQVEIVRRAEALFYLADTVERRVATATTRADKLTQAILAKAFRGELVPTEAELARSEGRSYEPASVLLRRVQQSSGDCKTRPSVGRMRRLGGSRERPTR